MLAHRHGHVRSAAARGAQHPAGLQPAGLRPPARVMTQASADGRQQHSTHAAVAAGLAAVLLLSGAPAHANPVFQGPARIVDGDTLYIGKEKIRLYGVDAPEKAQKCNNSRGQAYDCGLVSLQALKDRVGSRPVRCEVKNKDQYGRNVAACSISPDLPFQQPEDIGTFLVSNGYAVAYRAYGKEYVPIEDQAHRSHKGIWSGAFEEPALWRKQQKAAALNASLNLSTSSSGMGAAAPALQAAAPAAAGSSSSAGAGTGGRPSYAAVAAGGAAGGQQQKQVSLSVGNCNGPLIKGNINSKGQRLYHTVNSGQYMRVEIDESRGERWFCTEEEALAAGWQPVKK